MIIPTNLVRFYFQIDGKKKTTSKAYFQYLSFIWSHIIIVFSLDFGGVSQCMHLSYLCVGLLM